MFKVLYDCSGSVKECEEVWVLLVCCFTFFFFFFSLVDSYFLSGKVLNILKYDFWQHITRESLKTFPCF